MTNLPTSNGRAIAERITAWRRPLLLTHSKPDGDALGAVISMALWLREFGAGPRVVVFDAIPDRYRFLETLVPLPVFGPDVSVSDLPTADGVLILDTCTFNQIEPLSAWIRESRVPKAVIDHHVTRDDLSDAVWIDPTAAATCVMLRELAASQGWPMSREIATALFVGVATDTGWFRHSNTDARTLAIAADLVAGGANASELHRSLYQRETLGRYRLRCYAGTQARLDCDGRLAVTILPRHAFAECGASLSDTEDLVNEPLQVASVAVSVMFVEQENGAVRVGFRSKPPTCPADPDIDVAAFAREFGGGGHVRASGARIQGSLDEAVGAVVPTLIARLVRLRP